MKINLPIFKDKDMKETNTYQSWHWDMMVYCQAGCQDFSFLPYIICSLRGYLGELVRSLGTNIPLDGAIAVVDEHYKGVKALDTLNQEFFQPQRNGVRLGGVPLRAPPNPCSLVPRNVSARPHC